MNEISPKEYEKLKESYQTYLVLGIILLFVFTPVGIVFLVLALVNHQKIQEYEKQLNTSNSHNQVADQPVNLPKMEHCPFCDQVLDADLVVVLEKKGFVFCSNCGGRITKN